MGNSRNEVEENAPLPFSKGISKIFSVNFENFVKTHEIIDLYNKKAKAKLSFIL